MKLFKNLITLSLFSLNFFVTLSAFSQAEKRKIKIVTSIPYLSDLVLQTSCHSKLLELNNLIPPEKDPHHFHITRQERTQIETADLIIIIGADFEPWSRKIQKSNDRNWLVITNNMELNKLANSDQHHQHGKHTHAEGHHHDDHGHEHNHLEFDPHIWQSPVRTKQAAEKISKELQKMLPTEAKNIESCTTKYLQTLNLEVTRLKQQIATIPAEKRKFATNHDALGYFASEFGFQVKSIVGLSDESSPTVARLKEIITEIKQENITALFLESTGNMRNIKTVSKETGVKIGGTLYSDSLGTKGSGAETAIDMWKTNVNTILTALKN